MKALLLVLLLTLCSYANASANCLSCMHKDKTATFLVSYSFCNSSDVCLQNRWVYIDRPCLSTPSWTLG